MTITINILDTLFFRDGKPFSMGDDTSATGLFPPLPSVFYGMLRTAYASQKEIPISEIESKTENLKIKSILFKNGSDFLFPVPADVFSIKGEHQAQAFRMKLVENNLTSSISNYPYILKTNKEGKIENIFGKAFLDEIDIKGYLSMDVDSFSFIRIDDIVVREPKIGIGRDNKTLLTKEGMLYRVDMIRPKNEKNAILSIIIEFEGLELENKGFLKIGAEGKMASYESSISYAVPKPKASSRLKIYLATPAIFTNGAIPKFFEDSNDIKLISMNLGKPIFAGGFDMRRRRPKPMKKAVPAGSVYYIETKNANEIIEKYHGKCISEERADEGFGLVFIGNF